MNGLFVTYLANLAVAVYGWTAAAEEDKRCSGVLYIGVIATIGVVSSLLMTHFSGPLIEWILPLSIVCSIECRPRSEAITKRVGVACTCLAGVGVLLFVKVVVFDEKYRVATLNSLKIQQAVEHSRLRSIQKKLGGTLGTGSYPPQDVTTLLKVDPAWLISEEVRPEWHSFVTRLHRVEKRKCRVWFSGGTIDKTGKTLQVSIRKEYGVVNQ